MTSKSAPTFRSFADITADVVGSAVASSFASMEEDNLPGDDSSKEDDFSHPWDDFSPKVGRNKDCPTTKLPITKGGLTSKLQKTKGDAASQVAQIATGKKKFKPMEVDENPNEVSPPPTEFGPDFRASSLRRMTSKELESFFLKKNRNQKTDKKVQLQM
jgi:hypothetical protein